MGQIVVFALLSAVYPTLIAATTVMLLLPRPEDLMFGFWLGAMITSVTCGLVIAFALKGTGAAKTSQHTASPLVDLVFAGLLALAAVALAKHEDRRLRGRGDPRYPKAPKKTPKWQQRLQSGNAWAAFVVAVPLSFPGVWYLAALDRLDKLHYSAIVVVLVVVAFCLVQLILIEIPMLAFKLWPKQTPIAIDHAKAWAATHWREYAVWGLAIVAALLVIRGVIGLLR